MPLVLFTKSLPDWPCVSRSRRQAVDAFFSGPWPVCAAFMGLLPILWSTAAGADVMKRIAAPMIGGLVTSFLLELLVYPAIYKLWKRRTELR